MKVVFLENVPSVAKVGEVKEVSGGFGRNYLLPRRLAVLATPGELARLEQERQTAARREAKLGAKAHSLADQITAQTVVLTARVGQQERLYGSITSQQIAENLAKLVGQPVDRRRLELDEPIRKLGTFRIPLQLTHEVSATVTVIVQGPNGERAAEPVPTAAPASPAPSASTQAVEPEAAPADDETESEA